MPKELDLQYHQAIEQIEEEKDMAFVTTFERVGMEKGMEKARQSLVNILVPFMENKFNNLPDTYLNKINQANLETLELWGKKLLHSKSIDEVFQD